MHQCLTLIYMTGLELNDNISRSIKTQFVVSHASDNDDDSDAVLNFY